MSYLFSGNNNPPLVGGSVQMVVLFMITRGHHCVNAQFTFLVVEKNIIFNHCNSFLIISGFSAKNETNPWKRIIETCFNSTLSSQETLI